MHLYGHNYHYFKWLCGFSCNKKYSGGRLLSFLFYDIQIAGKALRVSEPQTDKMFQMYPRTKYACGKLCIVFSCIVWGFGNRIGGCIKSRPGKMQVLVSDWSSAVTSGPMGSLLHWHLVPPTWKAFTPRADISRGHQFECHSKMLFLQGTFVAEAIIYWYVHELRWGGQR